jgi:hypothetical protein
MIEQWQELKETITEMRDNDGTSTQQEVCKFLANYMEVLEKQMQEPCEDCISRQAVDDAIYDYSRSCDVNYEQIMEFIDKLPPVKPKYTDEEIDKAQAVEQAYVDKMVELAVEETKRPKGKWIFHRPFDGEHKNCNECIECNQCHTWLGYDCYAKTPYCPNCGAEMSGGGEDEVSN